MEVSLCTTGTRLQCKIHRKGGVLSVNLASSEAATPVETVEDTQNANLAQEQDAEAGWNLLNLISL